MAPLDLTAADLTTDVLHTEQLVLRPHRSEDVDAVHRACQDPDIQRWILALPVPTRARTSAPSSSASPRRSGPTGSV